MNRRSFVKAVLPAAQAFQAAAAGRELILYFVDGYHGGVKGHMPAGAWRDIVTRLQSTPDWKLCLDIEAASWVRLAEDDPESFDWIKRSLRQSPTSGRLEMVGGTFSQPYGWAITGESNIRQLTRGLQVIRQSFPGLAVETYAMQEPCWASCLPQILLSLGFKAAVLKNPSTAWGGYSVGIDAETINWIGSDGASIRTVPRYACEALVDTWRTEAQIGSQAFAEKCIAHGIPHPVGMCFQDLGWAARPNVQADYIRFVTWSEYFERVAGPTTRDWRFGIEDIRCALPWGEKTLQKVARQVRSAENRLLVAEKIAALSSIWTDHPYPSLDLQDAWDSTLWSQHHDAWITANTRSGRDAWAFQVAAETWNAENLCNQIIDRSLDALVRDRDSQTPQDATRSFVSVFNTLAHARRNLVEIDLATTKGTENILVRDPAGNRIPSQFQVRRKYVSDPTDESIGAVHLVFQADVPATGHSTFTIETVSASPVGNAVSGAIANTNADGSVTVETDLYLIRFDPKRGGTISSLFSKPLQREFCIPGGDAFHEFRGYFIEQKSWQSSTEHPAAIEILEHGPVRVVVSINGFISDVSFRTVISVIQTEPRIEFRTQFRFNKDTWIGDPYEIKPGEARTGRRRSEYDDRYKLLARFPVSLNRPRLYKNAAFDVCRSENTDTFFQSWDAIKHNIIVNWVDLADEHQNTGIALFSDHTTSYAQGENHPLSLVMAWGWDGGFWWGKCPLNGVQEVSYAIVPHAGRWENAALWKHTLEMSEPLMARLSSAPPKKTHPALVRIGSEGVYLTALISSGSDILLRFFNAESTHEEHELTLGLQPRSLQLVELDGRVIHSIRPSLLQGGSSKVQLRIPQFALRTLKLSL